ncbi:MobC family plasmid mobilization relaxosome protein [Labilibaculum antarcticum]|uniref:Mobilization protein n=1 Tax=Labilibaculum antarcticum TaxID=1717717 RepID=A0A1Y1CLF5_9BACT|nr:MobC family plasmid mobilization relaxosome protein [Labilibaculum antarcticum]BAX80822.1 mobilization protein [Labilibaculum antarcticum]
MANFNKGGRPRKSTAQKKRYKVDVKMATEEYYVLKSKAQKANLTISEYMRQCIAVSSVRERITPEVQIYIRKLCGMANNLNQIARKANAQGYTNVRKEYIHLADQIDQLIDRL